MSVQPAHGILAIVKIQQGNVDQALEQFDLNVQSMRRTFELNPHSMENKRWLAIGQMPPFNQARQHGHYTKPKQVDYLHSSEDLNEIRLRPEFQNLLSRVAGD